MRALCVLLLAIVSALDAPAQTPTATRTPRDRPFALMVGDPAPPLAVTDWLKGQRVTGFERGKIYVVTFWASWCTSCIAEFPDLTGLQARYLDKGVVLIAVSRPDSNGCTLDEIKNVMSRRDADMGFASAWDGKLETHTAWMKGAGRRGLPSSFVIDQNGTIAAIDSGERAIERVVSALLAGTYDLKGAAARYRSDRLAGVDTERFVALIREKDFPGAYTFAREALKGELNDCAAWLSVVAWESMDPRRERDTWDLGLAWLCASHANTLVPERDNCDVLNTYARACFLTGRLQEAVDAQQVTVDRMKAEGNSYMVEQFGKSLAEYRAALEGKK